MIGIIADAGQFGNYFAAAIKPVRLLHPCNKKPGICAGLYNEIQLISEIKLPY
jgi:hypothetical protein